MILLQRFCFALCMSLVLSFLMSGWVTFINLGASAGFIGAWSHAFLLAWPAAFVISLGLGGVIGRLANALANRIGERTGLQSRAR